jgi:hypothetical protein
MPEDSRPHVFAARTGSGYRAQSEDTSEWADRAAFDELRKLDSRETAELIGMACRMMNDLVMIGLRRDHPHASEDELELRAAVLKYGPEFVERFTGRTLPPT